MSRNTLAALSLTTSPSLTLAACGSGGGAVQNPAPAASTPPAASGAPSSGMEDDVLTVGMECTYVPYDWVQMDDSNGAVPISNMSGTHANGYDMMITQRICDANGWELEVVSTTWDSLTPALQSGTIDVAIAGQSMATDRMAQVDMAGLYYYVNIVCLTAASSAYAAAQGIADLADGRCTAQSGTIWYNTYLPQIPDAQVQAAMETVPAVVMQLQTGTVGFVCTDLPTTIAAAANDSDLIVLNFVDTEGDFQFASKAGRAENVSIDMSATKGSTELLDAINTILDGMTADDFNTLMDRAITVQPGVQAMEHVLALGQDMAFLWTRYAPLYLSGVVDTLLLVVAAIVLGCLVGLACDLFNIILIHPQGRLPRRVLLRLLRAMVRVYAEVFRDTPVVLQAVFLYYGLPHFTNNAMRFDNTWTTALLVVSINTGVYMAGSVRGGILSVGPGQTKGAKVTSMSHVRTAVSIILPQALHNIMPQIGNSFIINARDTSVIFIIDFTEFFATHHYIISINPMCFPSAAIEMPGYLCMTSAASALLRLAERRMDGESNYELVQADALTITAGTCRRRTRPQDEGGALT